MQTKDQAGTAERGMELAASLPDIMPPQANDRIKPVYDDIQQVLRVPIVNRIFRTLANYPDYLESAWRQIRPVACLRVFEQSANELRARALLAQPPEPSDLAIDTLDDMAELRSFNDTIHYVLPKLLLIVTALAREPADQDMEAPSPKQIIDLSEIPCSIAEGTGKVKMIEPEKASEHVRTLFESIKKTHAHPLVSSYYRGLANWPGFLEAAWGTIGPRVGSVEYEERKRTLIDDARLHVRDWPEISVQGEPSALTEIQTILVAFQTRFIPEMLLDVTLIKSLVDGSHNAISSRFSVA
jgi:hypothetical protein